MNELEAILVEHLVAHGPIGFDEYVDHALYTPDLGFYAAGGGAGRRRDFLTSPEVGPLFGAVLAGALDSWWDELGCPDPFPVVEAGAGPGTLARTILAAGPRCASALSLVLVEAAEVQWSTHPAGVSSRTDLPAPGELGTGPVVVLANELLDNLPFGLVELADGGWCEVAVAASGTEGPAGSGRLVEVLVPLEPRRAAWCWGKAGRDAAVGTRLPVQAAAAGWLDDALELAAGGRVVVIDYAATTRELARRPWTEWVRTYAAHGRGADPLRDPGSCDITVEVAVDQLATVAEPDRDRDQATFLRAHGIDALVAEGAARWRELGAAGGLPAIAGRSRVHEADALTDPTGLGAFRVLEWHA
ncbi:SAM-dependent methyltransferase [Aquihabitans sp. G128]|uniref:SAM-dependent methyltransferase n=1 Tax=Aquihabitans sp. G128 TaxID=2849779 RepID=UPI001C24274C|nr:SAM-dependent methyltransferase [Aquihabitans sp. G128]QXC60193.1 SAM-dependent methyltransferase [Aquihabitans sp. G128]